MNTFFQVPAYEFGWETLWPLKKEAVTDMSNDLSLMYYDSMRNVLQKENQGTDPVVLPTQLSRFWNGMEIFLNDFPQRQWSLVQGYGGGFANGVRSVLLDNDHELKRSYLDALTQSQPCCQLNDVMLNNWPHTVAGVKDLSARRGISIYHNNASVHTVVGCSNDDSNTVPIAEGDHSFTTEAWIAPNHLTQPNHIFLSTVNQDKTTGYKLTAQQYQEGYKWSCHVEDQYNSASMTLTLFNQTTNGTTITSATGTVTQVPLQTDTTAKDLKLILESVSNSMFGYQFKVYVMGIDPSSSICTSGTTANRSFIIHFYDVEYRNTTLHDISPIQDVCTSAPFECRQILSNDTVLNLGETSGRTIFNINWNHLVLNAYELTFQLITLNGLMTESLPNYKFNNLTYISENSTTLNNYNPNRFVIQKQLYHRWEFSVYNGTHSNIITGPRITTDPESGTHVTGTAFQTDYHWHHVVLTYNQELHESKMIIDIQDSIDLYYVTSDYLLRYSNIIYTPSLSNSISIGALSSTSTTDFYPVFHIESLAIYNYTLSYLNHIVPHYYSMLDQTMGQDKCTPCRAGEDCQKTLTSDHIVVPSPCATGKYRNQASTLVSCSKCPEGRYSLKRGLKHYTECQQCPEGLVCEVEGANNLEYRDDYCYDQDLLTTDCQATLCPEDAVCGIGTKKETMLSVKCPPGHYCTYGTCTNGTQVLGLNIDSHTGIVHTVRSTAAWYECPERYYCDEGTTYSTKIECPSGRYCPKGSALYCCTPACKYNAKTIDWMSKCDPVSLQSATLEADVTALSISYPFTLNLPEPIHLGKTCKSGTSSLRKAGSNDDCFVDWNTIDAEGPSFYLFPFSKSDTRFINKNTRTAPVGTTGNSNWKYNQSQCKIMEKVKTFQKKDIQKTEKQDAAPKTDTSISYDDISYYNVEDLPRIAVPATSIARIVFNFTSIPERLQYDNFFRISIFIDSGIR